MNITRTLKSLKYYAVGIGVAGLVAASAVVAGPAGADPIAKPNAPANLQAAYTNGNSYVTLSWNTPTEGNPPSYTYVVTAVPGAETCTTGSLSCEVTNLTPGTSYKFSVTAGNAAGTSAASASTTEVLITQVPGAVTNLSTQYTPGSTTLSVSWGVPSTGYPAPSSYQVTEEPSGSVISTSNTDYTYSDLTPGTTVTISVVAVNVAGKGTSSLTQPVTIGGPPGAVGSPTASYVSGTPGVTVSWSAPATGYPVPSKYVVTASPGGKTCVTTTTTCVVTGLSAGVTYDFSIVATNTYGSGPSATTNAIVAKSPPSAPGRPTFAALRAGVTSVRLSWAPSATCGSGCEYSVWTGSTKILTTTSTVLTVSGLKFDKGYTFKVTATNSDGTSEYSTVSKSAVAWRDSLGAGGTLSVGHWLWSSNHRVRLGVVSGHLEIRSGTRVLWSKGSGGTEFVFSGGGTALLKKGGAIRWSSGTREGSGIARVSDSGALLIYRGSVLVWSSRGGKVRPVTTTTVYQGGGGTTTTRPPTTTTTVPGVPIP